MIVIKSFYPLFLLCLAATSLVLVSLHKKASAPQGFAILMYHDISPRAGRFSVSPENFRKHLAALYKEGFITARLDDVINGRISKNHEKIVVLRFDDSRKSHFRYYLDSSGTLSLDPDCAVSILLEFSKIHPAFGAHAAFCVVALDQFHQPRYAKQKLLFLLDNGMEIVNHTYDHPHLSHATPEEIDSHFGRAMTTWESLLGERANEITILAAPYGALPESHESRSRMQKFSWNNKSYTAQAILCAGRKYHRYCSWPEAADFNRFELPSYDVTTENFADILHSIKRLTR